MGAPGQRGDQPRSTCPEGAHAEQKRAPKAVQRVVERHGARMELAAVKPGPHPEAESDVGAGGEEEKLPEADAVPSNFEDRGPGQPQAEQRIDEPALVHRASSALRLSATFICSKPRWVAASVLE